MVEVVEPFKLYPTPIRYTYKVIGSLSMLWMDIQMQTNTINTTNVSPNLVKLAKFKWWMG
jgi:hypothetical protein